MVTPHTGPPSTIDGRRVAGEQAQADLPMPMPSRCHASAWMPCRSDIRPAHASPKIIPLRTVGDSLSSPYTVPGQSHKHITYTPYILYIHMSDTYALMLVSTYIHCPGCTKNKHLTKLFLNFTILLSYLINHLQHLILSGHFLA